jgi:hypothetical protein
LKVGGAVFRILEFEHEVTFELPELHVDADYPATTTGSMVDTSSANVLVTDEMSVQNELPAVVNS